MSKVLTRPTSSTRRLVWLDVVTTCVVGVVFLSLVSPHLGDEPRVDVTLENETDFTVAVQLVVEGGVMPLAHVPRHNTMTVHDVIDVGRIVRLRILFTGEELAVVEVSDDQLRSDGFVVAIPESINAELHRRGEPPTP